MRIAISILTVVTVFNGNAICLDFHQSTHLDGVSPDVFITEIPNLDPIEFDLVELSYPGEIFGASVNISKASISGLSNYQLLELEFSENEPAVTFHIVFPAIKLYAENYELEGLIFYIVPLKGQGIAHFEIQNLQLKGTLYMKTSGPSNSVEVEKLENAELTVERIVSHTEFDHNIDKIISKIVEDLMAGYINRFSKYFLVTYSDVIIQYINEAAKKLELNRLTN